MQSLSTISLRLFRQLLSLRDKLIIRVAFYGVLALGTLGVTEVAGRFIPSYGRFAMEGQSVDRLLDIIANAMLAATIFSLTVVVNVYRSSSTQWTPRVHRLLMEDRASQNTLAAFIGAYVFALTAIVAREVGGTDGEGDTLLFWVTVAVILMVVIRLIRWTLHLQTFGSLIDTTRQVEAITREKFRERLETPCLGGHPLTEDTHIPDDAHVLRAPRSGYVDQIYQEALQEFAEEQDLKIYVVAEIGHFVFLNEPIARFVCEGDGDVEDITEELLGFFELGDVRTHHQDPRFGLQILSEIASRALSPGINDPGTAIDVCNRSGAILSEYVAEAEADREPVYDRLWVPALSAEELIEDAFDTIARNGAAIVEVQTRLLKVLKGLTHHPEDGLAAAAARVSRLYAASAREALSRPNDIARLDRIALKGDE